MTKKTLILISFIAIKFLLGYLLLSPDYDLQRDEYLHLDLGNHLAWGYISVPPFTAWTSWIIQLFGNGVFWVKFFPALYGCLTLLVVWKAIEELKGNLFALILGATCVLFSCLLRLNMLYQPNSFDVLSWTVLYFILIKYFNSENTKWLYFGAVVFSFGFLNKYNIVFLFIGLLPALFLSQQRKVFLKPQLYQAFLLGLVLILPNLYWQFQNDFPVIHHMKELANTQLINVNRWGFIKSQILFFPGSLILILASFYAFFFYKPFKNYRFFFFSICFTLTAFLYFKAKDYYAIGIYPIYIAFGAVYLENVLQDGWKKYLKPVLFAIPLLLFIPMYRYAFPNRNPEYIIQHAEKYEKLGMLRWEDGKDHLIPQDYADMLGWKELAHKVDSVYLTLPNKNKTLIICDNYGQAGAINYYTKQNLKAVSFNADYINWFDLSVKYQNLIRVKDQNDKMDELEKTAPYFQKSMLAGSVTNQYSREVGTPIFVFIGAKIDINKRVESEIEKAKIEKD